MKKKSQTAAVSAAVDGGAVLTVAETAKLLRLGRITVYKAVRSGKIPFIRIGRKIGIPRASIGRMLGETAEADRTRAHKDEEPTSARPPAA